MLFGNFSLFKMAKNEKNNLANWTHCSRVNWVCPQIEKSGGKKVAELE